jgi:hypothetical protein
VVDAARGPWSAPRVQIAFFTLLIGMVIAIWFVASGAVKKARSHRGKILQEALTEEDPAVLVDPTTGTAECKVRGVPVRFRFATRGSGSSAESWTEVEVTPPPGPLVLSMRRQRRRDAKLIRDGLAVDVLIGDPELDEKYLIEGAPAEIVKRVFTLPVRQKLLALDLDELEASPGTMKIARRGWKEEHDAVQALVDLAVSLAEAVAPAVEATKQAEAPVPTSAYRGSAVSPEEQRKWQAAREEVATRQAAEVTGLEEVRERRKVFQRGRMMLIVGGMLAFLVVAAIIMSFGK